MSKEGTIEVTPALGIPRWELEYRASRAGGAGGQHVNTSSTRIELLWNPGKSVVLDDTTRARVIERLASRLDGEGWLRIVSSARRSQQQNREAAESRLADMVRRALFVQKKRRPTKPTRASKEARIAQKRKRSETKRQRRGDLD